MKKILFFAAPTEEGGNSKENVALNGNGTQENPYQINSRDDLISYRDKINKGEDFKEKYFIQTTDIDLGPLNDWMPIGTMEHPFSGFYDGKNHKIYCIKVNVEVAAGFFGCLSYARIENLTIEEGSVHGELSGAICGHIRHDSTIKNCHNKTVSVFGKKNAGGICGDSWGGKIRGCTNTGKITGEDNSTVVGGIAGTSAFGALICSCINRGDVNNRISQIGGICASNNQAIIANCINAGMLGKTQKECGNICGWNNGFIFNSYFYNDLSVSMVNKNLPSIGGGKLDGMTAGASTEFIEKMMQSEYFKKYN